MLDENLPTFYINPSNEKPKEQSTLYVVKGGEEAQPSYSLRHLDPSAVTSRNRYAVGLYDSYIPSILYAEALIIPKWTQPTLSQDAIRANGGVAPPPEPILPTEFTIQLYNPDQQVLVRHKAGSWNSAPSWQFELPQKTFRQPSTSVLDRTLSDPAASDITPKLRFNWRKDGKLSKDLGCYLSGKTSHPDGTKQKVKDPDITVAIFKGLREITLYEPNLYRVEMEDFKGLEVVLMLGAVIIRDVYYGNMKECFHIGDPPKPGSSVEPSKPPRAHGAAVAPVNGQPRVNGAQPGKQSSQVPPNQQAYQQQVARPPPPQSQPQPPPADPRTQWEIDAESKRLKQQTEAEARERRRQEKETEKRTKKLLETEKKEARKRQAKVEQETERLRKMYGKEESEARKRYPQKPAQQQPPVTSRPNHPPRPPTQPSASHHRYSSHGGPVPGMIHGPSSQRPSQPPAHPPRPGAGGLRPPQQQQVRGRTSILGLFKREEEKSNALTKKRSSMF